MVEVIVDDVAGHVGFWISLNWLNLDVFVELYPAVPCVPEGGSRRRSDVGSARVFAAARLETRAPVTGAAATATATAVAAAATAESTIGPVYRSFCQFGNECLEFVVDVAVAVDRHRDHSSKNYETHKQTKQTNQQTTDAKQKQTIIFKPNALSWTGVYKKTNGPDPFRMCTCVCSCVCASVCLCVCLCVCLYQMPVSWGRN